MAKDNPRGDGGSQTPRTVLLHRNLLASALVFAFLEWWHPCFFLTDDNLGETFPYFSEIGRHLLSGQNPFILDNLFGGNYHLLKDIAFLNWHPVYLVASLLVATPAHFLIIDVSVFAFLMLATAGFVNLIHFLRGELSLKLSDGWLMFYSLSFTYTYMMLATAASWLPFLANYCALPWLTLGILQKSWWRGAALVTLFTLHQLLGGWPAGTITCSLFLSFFALGLALGRRSTASLLSWMVGYGVALVILLPILWPALQGFTETNRFEKIPIEQMQISRIPLGFFPISYLFGTSMWLIHRAPDFHAYQTTLAACAAGWCLLPALLSRAKWKSPELLCVSMMALALLMIVRPYWLSEALSQLPVLRSLRMPFRELLVFHFFLHLFLAIRPPGLTAQKRQVIAVAGALVFLVPLLLYAPPSFNPMKQERQLLFSGELDRYWDQVKMHLGPEDRVAVIVPEKFLDAYTSNGDGEWAPFGLLGMQNYACLEQVKNASGYSPTPPHSSLYLHTPVSYLYGGFIPAQEEALWQERPDLKLMVLESLKPIRITLRSRTGPGLDLTPYVPQDATYP